MKTFLAQLDTARIERAIADAEKLTSGELRVVFQAGEVTDVTQLAHDAFARLGMTSTRERNAVLILIAPDARQFALYGDAGVHAKCGDDFWRNVAAAMEQKFRTGQHTDAVIEGIARAGELLAREFPHRPDDRDELPNTVVQDPPPPRVI
ncbi:MAG: TPM domain-containing protein [Candidatus Didemnitutus sp.]|nr:TPM domain-containing protein [Candidatus Didemnitutus sp.]